MSSFALKIIAMATMLIDHMTVVLFRASNYYIYGRAIGRLSFPIYCFLLVEGVCHTQNIWKYAGRMLLFAIISEIPYDLVFYGEIYYSGAQNVFFELFLGIVMLGMMTKVSRIKDSVGLQIVLISIFSIISLIVKCDYDMTGIILLYIFNCVRVYGKEVQGISNAAFMLVTGSGVQKWAALAGLPIALYNGEKGYSRFKYLFYVFYPAHMLILYMITALWSTP